MHCFCYICDRLFKKTFNLTRPISIILLWCHRYGEERYEKRDLQIRVRQQFEKLERLDKVNGRVPWYVVSAAQSIDAVQRDIWNIVLKTLARVKNGTGMTLGRLWDDGDYVSSISLTTSADESEKENI